MQPSLIAPLDAGDRALFARWVLAHDYSRTRHRFWRAVTALGGARVCVAVGLVGLALSGGRFGAVGQHAAWTLLVSHLIVQAIKRSVGRPRPALPATMASLIETPDRFSFPSGHSCAVMAVAFPWALALPNAAAPLMIVATIVGLSRVRLGVHYPGDVLAGQVIAVVTALALVA
ncbi:MAG: phosphatase PAP2 family protein [Gemmatimonadaceae bacterium]|nr:phosphatase PAP2 family protein [Gemmatimonadaceae bacterium]